MGANTVLGPLSNLVTALALPIERLACRCVACQFGAHGTCRQYRGQGNRQEEARCHGRILLAEV